jgi:ketosteroid isomerase-like protein
VAAPSPEQEVRKRCAELTRGINARDLRRVRNCYSTHLRVRAARGTERGYGQVLYSMAATFRRYPKFRTKLDVDKVVVRGDKAYCTAAYKNSGIGRHAETGRCNMVWKRSARGCLLARLDHA